jgi:hypothetical protein
LHSRYGQKRRAWRRNKSFQRGSAVDSEWLLVARWSSGGIEASWVALLVKEVCCFVDLGMVGAVDVREAVEVKGGVGE